LVCVEIRPNAFQRRAQKLRGNNRDNNFSVADGGVLAGDRELGREGKAGQEGLVLTGVDDLLGKLGAVRPERDLMASTANEREGEGGSPSTGT
jgi:hypothetical protein